MDGFIASVRSAFEDQVDLSLAGRPRSSHAEIGIGAGAVIDQAFDRPPGSRRARIETVGSVGPTGSIRSGLRTGGFVFTLSTFPKGLGGTEPSRISQRRL